MKYDLPKGGAALFDESDSSVCCMKNIFMKRPLAYYVLYCHQTFPFWLP